MNPGESWPPEESQEENTDTEVGSKEAETEETHDLPPEFVKLVAGSSLVPAICSYLRNDSGKLIC